MVCGEGAPLGSMLWMAANPTCVQSNLRSSKKATPKSKNRILLVTFWPKTGVDVNFCATVPKMRPQTSKKSVAKNSGRDKFCASDIWLRALFAEVRRIGASSKSGPHMSVTVTHARTDVRLGEVRI